VGIYRLAPGEADWALVARRAEWRRRRLQVPVSPGTYRTHLAYQTYSTSVLDDVAIAAGETKDFLVTLTPRTLAIKGMEVKGTEKRNTEAAALSKQKKPPT